MQTQPEAPRFHEPALGYDDGLPLFAPRSGILSRSNSSLFSTLQGMKDQEGCWRPRRDLNPCYRRERAMS